MLLRPFSVNKNNTFYEKLTDQTFLFQYISTNRIFILFITVVYRKCTASHGQWVVCTYYK